MATIKLALFYLIIKLPSHPRFGSVRNPLMQKIKYVAEPCFSNILINKNGNKNPSHRIAGVLRIKPESHS
jgi:hypothetical protein